MKMQIGDYLTIRNVRTLINGAKTENGRTYIFCKLNELCEMNDFMYAEIHKISARKFQLCHLTTEDNGYNLTDENVYFTQDWYNISMLNNVMEFTYCNEFMGECTEIRPVTDTD